MNENKDFKTLEIEEMMCLDGGAKNHETIDTRFWNEWFANLFGSITP